MIPESIIFHIDVNSAFLSWSAIESRRNGCDTDLRDIPSIIGGDRAKRHGVVLAKSIPAKAYGVKTGEPVTDALRKCPFLVIEKPDHDLYQKQSLRLMEHLSGICPDLEQVSIDECYMDFIPVRSRYSSPEAAAEQIKDGIKNAFGFTVNIGISDRKILAKMASGFRKPDLVHTLYSWEIKEKMWGLPVSALHTCGKSSAQALRNLGIITIGDLAAADPGILSLHLKSHGIQLHNFANGIDPAKVETISAAAKCIGNSTTLSRDARTAEEAKRALLSLADSVSRRLRESGQTAGSITTEIKYHTFRSISHQSALSPKTATTETIYTEACRLFDEVWDGTPIRLLGIRTSKLSPQEEPVQLSLFDYLQDKSGNEKQEKLDAALDSIRRRFGSNAVIRGSFLSNPDEFKKH